MGEEYLDKYWSTRFAPLRFDQIEGLARPVWDSRYALDPTNPIQLLEAGYLLCENGLAQLDDGRLMVAVLHEFPGSTARMVDWWFGFTEYESKRYQIWHPLDHLAASRKYDWRDKPTDRERYVGNTGVVDEYVGGGKVLKLNIVFHDPAAIGLDQTRVDSIGTAVCAKVFNRETGAYHNSFCHFVRNKPTGCEVRSRFWLETDDEQLGRRLLAHSADEYAHLAEFLPQLYLEVTRERPSHR
jgi:hypothetical protein